MSRLTTSLAPTDIFTYTSDRRFDLGGEGITPDGRLFRYAKCNASTAVVPGKLYQSTAEDTTNWENLSIAAATAGTYTVTTTSTVTLTLNQLAGGYLCVTETPGLGRYYKIVGNTAAITAVTTITLEDAIQVALTTASKIDLIPDPYGAVEIWDATNHDGMCVGVGVSAIPASYYGWLQVGGPCSVLGDAGTCVTGSVVVASDDTDGAVGPYETDALYSMIGTAITGIASADYGMVNLRLH